MNPFGKRSYYFTYEPDTTETSTGWRIGFVASVCEPRQGSYDFYSFTCRGLSGEDPKAATPWPTPTSRSLWPTTIGQSRR